MARFEFANENHVEGRPPLDFSGITHAYVIVRHRSESARLAVSAVRLQ